MRNDLKKIVVVGGGTGTYSVLAGLKKYVEQGARLSAIVAVSDSGGSTGRLRDEFGFLPVGDFRMALVALSDDNSLGLLRKLFMYRFDRGAGLAGHNFGNLFLVAMSEILGSTHEAIRYASKVLRVRGKVIPVSDKDATLVAQYADGSVIIGETNIDEPPSTHDGSQRISALSLVRPAELSDAAREAITEADLIVLGPGDLYTSTIANLVVTGMKEALCASTASLVYILNLMSRWGQTHGFSAEDYVAEVARYAGRIPDHVILNSTPLPADIAARYKLHKEFPVEDNLTKRGGMCIHRLPLLAPEEIIKPSGDVLRRSLIRHDPDKLGAAVMAIATGASALVRPKSVSTSDVAKT